MKPSPGAVRKPRVAILGEKYCPSRGGTSRVVEGTLRQLAPHYDFTLYCYANPAAEPSLPGVRTVQFPAPRRGGVGVFLYYLRCLVHALRADYDLVHVHKTDAAFALPFLTARFPCVATSHEVAYLNDKWSRLGRLYFRVVERVFVRSRATLTCVSLEQQEHYRRRYAREVQYLPNGVEELALDDAAALRLLAQAGVRQGFLLFAARRLIPLKGLHTLLDALHRLGFAGQLVVLGDREQVPAYSAELQAQARGLDVHFLGYVAERATLLALVKRAALFVFPSEREGMSVMLLEAAACGTPIVCSDIRQNTDVLGIRDVLAFRSQDARDLAEKLRWAVENPDEMGARAARARATVAERFSARSVAHEYDRLYRRALQTADPVRWGQGALAEARPPEVG